MVLSFVFSTPTVWADGPTGEAPKQGQLPGRWSSAIKQGFGTAYEAYDNDNRYSGNSATAPLSRVWFTVAEGVLTEVYWPTIDTPQVRDSQFLVTDGKSFFFEERKNSETSVHWLETGVPAFRIENKDPKGRFKIERLIYTDPDRDVVLQKVRVDQYVPNLQFYYLHNPQVSNTPMGNSARVAKDALYAWQEDHAQAVRFSIPLKKVSAGFSGPSDGFQDLTRDFQMDWQYETATTGNVVTTAWLELPAHQRTVEFYIALGFGTSPEAADTIAKLSLQAPQAALEKYLQQWRSYESGLIDLGSVASDNGDLYLASVSVVKSLEDKTREGAFIASPTVPWGHHIEDNNKSFEKNSQRLHLTGGYHLVWPRDLYHMASTFLAIGDSKSAVAALQFLKSVQIKGEGEWVFGHRRGPKAGTFPQNCWVDGTPHWVNLQLDEVAFPILLVHRLWKQNLVRHEDYWAMARSAADFIKAFGPWSPQERWEEIYGASPSTIAAQISALWAAAELAHEAGDFERARQYKETADHWAYRPGDNISTWTFTSTGKHGNGRYYVRIEGAKSWDQIWNPNDNVMFPMANGVGLVREKDITDGGFLELVRLGVRRALDPQMVDSLPEYDATIRRDLPGIGPGFFRYLGDRYNYEETNGAQADGMLWPLLTGERGHYEMQRAVEAGQPAAAAMQPYLQAMEKMATPSLMIPEQVWDAGARMGQPTGAATPLGWAHGEYIKALRSTKDGKVFDKLNF